jgi:peptidoglycan/xylan/chitin deacetylase (PgdA/CDA1 family)
MPALRKRVLTFIAAFFYFSGLVKLARWWTQQSGQRLVILNYHHATGGDFRRHLLYLRRHYRILHLEAALEELYTSPVEGYQKQNRRPPLVLTFDDGYHDNYTEGFALARELQVPITIFLIPNYIESGDYFWWKEGTRLVCRAQMQEASIEGRTYHLDQGRDRRALTQAIDRRLRLIASITEREAFLVAIRKALAVPHSVSAEEIPALPLTWEEVQQMKESGWVSFGAHTMHHPILAYLSNPTEVEYEVSECRARIQEQLKCPVRTFAYPVGQFQHIGDDVWHVVRKAGYDWALTTVYGFNTVHTNPYLLRRIETDVSQHWLVLAAEAAGLWGFFSRLRWVPAIRKYLMRSQ